LIHDIFYDIALYKDGFIQQRLIIFSIDQFTAFDGSYLGADKTMQRINNTNNRLRI
jgi:hypothetical protein